MEGLSEDEKLLLEAGKLQIENITVDGDDFLSVEFNLEITQGEEIIIVRYVFRMADGEWLLEQVDA